MISNIRKIPKLFLYLLGHWSFLKSINVVKTKQLIIVLFLATLTVLCEAIGLSIIIPILSFIESGNDLEKFKNSSLLTKNVVNIQLSRYSYFPTFYVFYSHIFYFIETN